MGFVQASAVTPRGDGFAVDIDPEWTIGGKPNGGYLLAIAARAAISAHPEYSQVLTASATYVSVPDPGPATVHVEVLRAGRNASQVRADLRQGDALCVSALLTLTRTGGRDDQPRWSAIPVVDVAPLTDCVRVPPLAPGGLPAAIMKQVEIYIDPRDIGFSDGNDQLRGWLTIPDTTLDSIALLYAVDAFPPATFGLGSAGWVPTLELTAYVRAIPAPGPLRVTQFVGAVDGGRVDEVCRVWDSTGRLVAQATQLAGVRFGPDGVLSR